MYVIVFLVESLASNVGHFYIGNKYARKFLFGVGKLYQFCGIS